MLLAVVLQYGGRMSSGITWCPLLRSLMNCSHQLQRLCLGLPSQKKQQPISTRCTPWQTLKISSVAAKQQGFQKASSQYSQRGQALQSPETPPTLWKCRGVSQKPHRPRSLELYAHTFRTLKEYVNHIIVHVLQKGFTEPQTAQLSLGVARRLSHFLNNWEVITDKWVLECVQGFQIPFPSLQGNTSQILLYPLPSKAPWF